MDVDDNIAESRSFTTFEKHDELLALQREFLSLDLRVDPINSTQDASEWNLLQSLRLIFAVYQEQSYLLDPYLESFVLPVIDTIKAHVLSVVRDGAKFSDSRVDRLCLLLYDYIKFRGYKNIVQFFPHEIADLTIVMDYISHSNSLFHNRNRWSLRYIVFLWLSLVCMIPFDLAQFDEVDQRGHTAQTLETLAKDRLSNAGLERDGAALLLARLYARKDASAMFKPFLQWSLDSLDATQDPLLCIGILQVLCEVAKSASAEEVQAFAVDMIHICNVIDTKSHLTLNTVVRKFRYKLVSRIGLRILPAKAARRKGRLLAGPEENQEDDASDDVDVPEDIESILEHLFQALQDKNTIVRYTSAKGIARISERLPSQYADQVLETVMSHFSIHSIAAASLYDLPAIAESTWHGACLGCAEMARRSLVGPHHLPTLIEWTGKALYFDLRKGAHSIGSNVRDAAAYVLWALARSQDFNLLLPHANYLAQQLATVAVFDREIHIRRAASAAFQEHVGRTGFVPHGIDVLQKTDFYSVSIRRNAFLIAAPAVARFQEYRDCLFDHLIDVTVRHWDVAMRQLGAESLRLLTLVDIEEYGPRAEAKLIKLLESFDNSDLHGALLALSELAVGYKETYHGGQLETKMRNVFRYLSRVPKKTVMGARHELVTSAACLLISTSITLGEIELSAQSSVPYWREVIDYGIKHRNSSVQEVAASALGSISQIVDSSKTVERLIRELQAASPVVQQSLGRCLGALAYDKHPNALPQAIACILGCITTNSSPLKNNIEGRRNCYIAIPQIISRVASQITRYVSSADFRSLFDALMDGLKDYTSDERGDVGSWVRIACVRGLAAISEAMFVAPLSQSELEAYLPPTKYHSAIAGILKQGVERLDNVRQEAGTCFLRLQRLKLPHHGIQWQIMRTDLFESLFPADENNSWGDGSWLYPKIVHTLDIEAYREQVLNGLILSLGSKTDSTHRPVASSIVAYCHELSSKPTNTYSLSTFAEDILSYAKARPSANAIVLPVMQSLNVLLESDALDGLDSEGRGLQVLQSLLAFCCKGIATIKSTQRIHESMKIVVHLLKFKNVYSTAASSLCHFLSHRFPSIRSDTAEYMYNFMQGAELEIESDATEELLLETEWSTEDINVYERASQQLIDIMRQGGLA